MNQEPLRPDPDVLLKRVNAEAARDKRTTLKVFFGFAPGVGKTYAMLESAQHLRKLGVDVVVGCVETHGRAETAALTEGLEVLPLRIVEYRGTSLHEFDLDAALKRKPQVLLLDELAHTNAAGSLHEKRFQDVLDLLDAGIEVHTTLNVQHVESLNDVIAQVTSVRVRETVPDAILDRADEIELIDLPPEDLLDRLHEGKVYLPDQALRAAQNFFQRGNLLALRELALRRTAERVDADVQAHREAHAIEKTWAAQERILVCVSPAPASARIVRSARRIAAGLRAPWIALYVESTTAPPLSQDARAQLDANLRLAASLGASVVRMSHANTSDALLDYARKHNVTRIIIGKPTHSRLRDLLLGSLLDQVVRGSGDIEVHAICGDPTENNVRPAPHKPKASAFNLPSFIWAAAWVMLATFVAWASRQVLSLPDLVMLYLVVIMIAAVQHGRTPALFAAVLSAAAYDFFFVPPFFTFAVSDTHHLLTFAMMIGVGVLISSLTMRIRNQEENARHREARTAALYALSRELGSTLDENQAAQVLSRHAFEVFEGGTAVLLAKGTQGLDLVAHAGAITLGAAENAVARWVLEHAKPAGLGTDTLPGSRVVCVPIGASEKDNRVVGVLALAPRDALLFDMEALTFLEGFVRQGALAIERALLADEAKSAALRARTEEMRSSLLSAVSHDLRTPLATITGAATTLRDNSARVSDAERNDMIETICEEAERLERLVTNLLDMTRLEAGLRVRREWVPLEEMVGSALNRLEKKLRRHTVRVELASNLPLLSVDPVLFEQVLVNLLENAAKYNPQGTVIEIGAEYTPGVVTIRVADHGVGFAPGDEGKVFEKFYRGAQVGTSGAGLGLAICKGIVEAHGGSVSASSRREGGAVFTIQLPLRDAQPPLAPEVAL